jgi:hypothetical protein
MFNEIREINQMCLLCMFGKPSYTWNNNCNLTGMPSLCPCGPDRVNLYHTSTTIPYNVDTEVISGYNFHVKKKKALIIT